MWLRSTYTQVRGRAGSALTCQGYKSGHHKSSVHHAEPWHSYCFRSCKHLAGSHSCIDTSICQYLAGTLDGELQKVLAFYGDKAADIEKELRDLERELPQLKPGQLESVEDEQVYQLGTAARAMQLLHVASHCLGCCHMLSSAACGCCLA